MPFSDDCPRIKQKYVLHIIRAVVKYSDDSRGTKKKTRESPPDKPIIHKKNGEFLLLLWPIRIYMVDAQQKI